MSAISLKHEPVSGIFHGKLGMWIFLASEIMFFSGFFAAFIILRNSNMQVFSESSHELNVLLATINTVALISSSLTMALSILYCEKGDQKKFRMFLLMTILFACVFLVIKFFEYSAKFSHHTYPSTNVFYALYFVMTGFHGIHVIGGMIPMVWMYFRSLRAEGYTNAHRVETLGLYWHFVDLAWIFIFPSFYLLVRL